MILLYFACCAFLNASGPADNGIPLPGPPGILPAIKPGTLSWNIAVIKPLYLSVVSVGITASPGESIAGTTSPAPFGPGTLITPSTYFLTGGNLLTAPLAPLIPPANNAGFCAAIDLICVLKKL